MVATLNHVATEEQDLHRHLFGRDRLAPPRTLREGLASLQAGRCFYCGTPFQRAPEADHFIPRVRCGIDAVENLVLADRVCNNDKRDLLPAPPLVDAPPGSPEVIDVPVVPLLAAPPGVVFPFVVPLVVVALLIVVVVEALVLLLKPGRPAVGQSSWPGQWPSMSIVMA